jgi:putative transposase
MAQSLHQCFGHLVFSTKGREPLIVGEIESRLYEYLGGIVRALGGCLIEINGMPDHIHLVIRQSKVVADQEFVGRLKGDSSRWVNLTFPGRPRFVWQAGYGWFSVGAKDLGRAVEYLRRQKEHHRTVTFREEYCRFLELYGVEYDERYLWD